MLAINVCFVWVPPCGDDGDVVIMVRMKRNTMRTAIGSIVRSRQPPSATLLPTHTTMEPAAAKAVAKAKAGGKAVAKVMM